MTKSAPFALATLSLEVISRHRGAATLVFARAAAKQEAQARATAVLLVWLGWDAKLGPEYVEPSGRHSKLYTHNGALGCVEQWTSRETGTQVGLYHGPQAGMDAEDIWCVVCEKHHTLVGHATLAEARRTRSPLEFCDDCRHGKDLEF